MSDTRSIYRACRELFTRFPQATRPVNATGTVCSMVLMLEAGDHPGFYVLSQNSRNAAPSYLLWPWPDGDMVSVAPEIGARAAAPTIDAVRHGVPIPRDGSLFGWIHDGAVSALVVVYAESVPDSSEPAWSVMPRVGLPPTEWPPFTGEPLFGHWSWDACQSGDLVPLDRLVAAAPGKVWWVDTKNVLGSDCCAVESDVAIRPGPVLQRGLYAYFQAQQDDRVIPALDELLKDPRRVDLASRFWARDLDDRHSRGYEEQCDQAP